MAGGLWGEKKETKLSRAIAASCSGESIAFDFISPSLLLPLKSMHSVRIYIYLHTRAAALDSRMRR